MGAFYTNITLRGPDAARVIATLESLGRTAYVGPTEAGCTVVFDSAAEEQDGDNERLAATLWRQLACPALAVTVHDDDILQYVLCEAGEERDRYDSAPGYFDGPSAPAEGGDAALLCRVIGGPRADPAAVEGVLRAPWKTTYRYETQRLAYLAEAVDLPEYGVGVGYNYIWQGDEEELEEVVVHVGDPGDADQARA